jgi:hypothetical protein
LIQNYYAIAPEIVSVIDGLPHAKGVYEELWHRHIQAIHSALESGDFAAAVQRYRNMVAQLQVRFIQKQGMRV